MWSHPFWPEEFWTNEYWPEGGNAQDLPSGDAAVLQSGQGRTKRFNVDVAGSDTFSLLLETSVDGGVTWVIVDEADSAQQAQPDASFPESARWQDYHLPTIWQLVILNTSAGPLNYVYDVQVFDDLKLG